MYMFYYFIRIAREILGRKNLQRIVIIAILFLILAFCFGKLGAFAYDGLDGDDTYTDPNSSIYMTYDSYLNDLAVRIMASNSGDCEDLIDRLCGYKAYSFICFYGTNNNDYSNDFQHLRVVLFPSSTQFSTTTAYTQWHQMDCEFVYNLNTSVIIYDFNNTTCTKSVTSGTFYFPYMLINRYNSNLIEVLANKTNTDTNSIVGAINNQTAAINNQTDKIEEQTQAITSTDFDENEVDVDTSAVDDVDNSTYTGLFSTIFTSFNNAISSDRVEYIRVPIPHSVDNILVPSNIVSSKIPSTFLVFIQGFWMYVFGFYAFKFANNLIIKIKDGSILEGYQSTDVISSEMM